MRNANTIRLAGVLAFGFILIVIALNLSGVQLLANQSFISLETRIRSFSETGTGETDAISLLEQQVRIESLESENKRLRDLLGFFDTTSLHGITANIIGRDPLDPSVVYIDQGSRSGLAVGQPAVAANGVLIGKVSHVTIHKATIELVVNDASRIAVKTIGDTGTGGILRGYGGETMRMELVIESESVLPGAVVVSSGLEAFVPENLIIGVLGTVEKSLGDLFAHSDVQPAVDFNTVRIISILLPV